MPANTRGPNLGSSWPNIKTSWFFFIQNLFLKYLKLFYKKLILSFSKIYDLEILNFNKNFTKNLEFEYWSLAKCYGNGLIWDWIKIISVPKLFVKLENL